MSHTPEPGGVVPTGDGLPITVIRHPRDTVLGAALELERLFPDLPAQEINRAAVELAQTFAEEISLGKQKQIEDMCKKVERDIEYIKRSFAEYEEEHWTNFGGGWYTMLRGKKKDIEEGLDGIITTLRGV